MQNKKLLILSSLGILLLFFFVGVKLYQSNQNEKVQTIAGKDMSVFVRPYSPKLGLDGAPVVLVEFLDPECESCREFSPMVKMLMKEFEGKIQLVIRYAPFHGNSMMMVKILEASRAQGKYWETLDVLFRTQPNWGSHHNPRPELVWTYLPEAGVDVQRIKYDILNPEIEKNLQQDIKDLETLGVKMTPSFFVNGIALDDFGYDQLRSLIMSELDK